jgi:hypothetical protein
MQAPAPVAVPVEITLLDAGDRTERAWRLTLSIGEQGVAFERDLPFERGRPVRLSFVLPDDDPTALAPVGKTREDREGRTRLVELTSIAAPERKRIVAYVQERMLIP